jgi:hypothetical protein
MELTHRLANVVLDRPLLEEPINAKMLTIQEHFYVVQQQEDSYPMIFVLHL